MSAARRGSTVRSTPLMTRVICSWCSQRQTKCWCDYPEFFFCTRGGNFWFCKNDTEAVLGALPLPFKIELSLQRQGRKGGWRRVELCIPSLPVHNSSVVTARQLDYELSNAAHRWVRRVVKMDGIRIVVWVRVVRPD